MEDFESLGLQPHLLQAIKRLNFDKPTPIQAQTIPIAIEGKNIIGTAQTGTGKTGAYGIPLIQHLIVNPAPTSALVVAPTRELALQILSFLRSLCDRQQAITSTLLIGGNAIVRELQALRTHPRIIVGTPGRINDHLQRGSLKLDQTRFVVLDEADRMMDMGFIPQLQKIATYLPKNRQTLMFSATMEPNVEKIAAAYLDREAVRVSVGSVRSPIETIRQEVIRTSESEKLNELINQLNQSQGSFIVFVKTKWSTEKLALKLRESGHRTSAIHGDLRQRHRERVIRNFASGRDRILIATDVASRGLDIPDIACVINYDLPQCAEDYIHRIGRTGRAGSEGKAVSLVAAHDYAKWSTICQLIDPHRKQTLHQGFPDPNRTFASRPKRSFKPYNHQPYKGNRKTKTTAA